MTEKTDPPNQNPVRDTILALVSELEPGKTISPEEAARAVSSSRWNKLLGDVRAEAVRLALAGEIGIFRKGKPVPDPEKFKGVYRLGPPASNEQTSD